MADTLPHPNLPKEVMSVSPFESPESSLEKHAKPFIEEEDDLGETIDLYQEVAPTRPLVELKPLPAGLRYAFLNGDKETPIIISDKLTDEETSKLIATLEKHRPIFGYSLQDLMEISPTLCTHRIPIDPASTPSQEPQRTLPESSNLPSVFLFAECIPPGTRRISSLPSAVLKTLGK